jgi:hypothetical protein
MLNQKDLEIKEKKITITQFSVLESLYIRAEVVKFIKKNMNFEEMNIKNGIAMAISTIYEIPEELLLKLFKNCSCFGIGGLNNKDNLNKAFENNLNGILELALEVLEFNGFFIMETISVFTTKFKILEPFHKMLQETIQSMAMEKKI